MNLASPQPGLRPQMPGETAALQWGDSFIVEVCFHSDWQIGTGRGAHAGVDLMTARDERGLPYVPGSSFNPLADTAEEIARALDGGSDGWSSWHRWLFGVSQPAAFRAGPAHIGQSWVKTVAALLGPAPVGDAATLVRQSLSVDPDTCTGQENLLRAGEYARVGLPLTSRWAVSDPADPDRQGAIPWQAEVLLRAAAQRLRHLGKGRRRGPGRVTVLLPHSETLVDAPTGHVVVRDPRLRLLLAEHDEDLRNPGDPPPPSVPPAAKAVDLSDTVSPQRMRRVADLRITALTPLLLPRERQGNLTVSHDRIPGASLLPRVCRAVGVHATELVAAARLIVTDATAEVRLGGGRAGRAVPTPLCLVTPKAQEDAGQASNLLRHDAPEVDRPILVSGWSVPEGEHLVRLRDGVPMVVQAHAVINDEKQRPISEEGGLYVYRAVAAGTVLRAEVWLEAGETIAATERLEAVTHLGYAVGNGYGTVRVEVLAAADNDAADGDATAATPINAGEPFAIWLTSDLLAYDQWGEPDATGDGVARAVGAALEQLGSDHRPSPKPSARVTVHPSDGTVATVMVRTRRHESWHAASGLPRPSLVVVEGGSVVVVVADRDLTCGDLERLEANGIGARRAEGFGRVRVQPWLLRAGTVTLRADGLGANPSGQGEPTVASPERPDGEPSVATTALVRASWRVLVDRAVRELVADPDETRKWVGQAGSGSGLGASRTVAAQLGREGNLEPLKRWVVAISTDQAWQQGQALRRWLDIAEVPTGIWSALALDPPPLVASDPSSQVHAVQTLLVEVASAQMRRRRQAVTGAS